MNCLKSNPFIACFIFILSSSFFSLSHGGFHDTRIYDHGMVETNTRRIVADQTNSNSTCIVLAADRTYREDPSDDFTFYSGGWNITNPHYLYSVTYSGIGPIVAAALWFVIFALCLLCLFVHRCCCRKKTYGYSRTAYVLSVVFLLIFTVAALVGSTFVYVDEEKFHDSILDIMSYVVKQARSIVLKLQDLINILAAKDGRSGVDISLPTDIMNGLDKINDTINDVADGLHNVTDDNSMQIRRFLNPLRVTIIGVALAMLALAVLGFLLSIFGLRRLVYCLIIIGWILVTATLIFTGIFLLVHNLITDTCVAMEEWLQNPTADSSMARLIPKVDNETAENILFATKGSIFGLISMANMEIVNISNANGGPNHGPFYYNQSGPLMPVVCNPYRSNLTDRHCAAGEISCRNATEVWANYVCEVSSDGICTTPGRLTPNQYKRITATVKIGCVLYAGMPFVLELIDSTYLRRLLSDISKDHCPSLGQSTGQMYVLFGSSSAAVMLSMILWIIYARERRHRAYTKKVRKRSSEYQNLHPQIELSQL